MDINSTAATIASWADLGVTIPAKLKQVAELYEAAEWVEEPWTGVDVSKVTVKTLEDTVVGLADTLAVSSQFSQAKQFVRDQLGRQLLEVAGEVVDELLNSLRPRFERAASVFSEAVHALPEDLSATSIVRSGTVALSAYNDALEAQAELKLVDSFLASLVYLPRFGGRRQDPAIRVLKPADRNELQALVNAAGTHKPEKYGDLSPLFVTAVRNHIPFVMNDPQQWNALRAEIEAQPVERKTNVRFAKW